MTFLQINISLTYPKSRYTGLGSVGIYLAELLVYRSKRKVARLRSIAIQRRMALHNFDNSGHDPVPLASFVHISLGDQTLDLIV